MNNELSFPEDRFSSPSQHHYYKPRYWEVSISSDPYIVEELWIGSD